MDSEKRRLEKCLSEHSKDGNVTVEEHNGKTIYQFDLIIDDSENRWGDIQPKVSAVSVEDGFVKSYNIRIGELDSEEKVNEMRDKILNSRPPCIDKFDTGHSDKVIQPHIRMNEDRCSVKQFTDFLDRLMLKIT